jgi:hypothetical protein
MRGIRGPASELPQSRRDRLARGSKRGWHAPDQPHQEGKAEPGQQEGRGDAEGKGQVRERLPVRGPRGEAVERQDGDAAERSATADSIAFSAPNTAPTPNPTATIVPRSRIRVVSCLDCFP